MADTILVAGPVGFEVGAQPFLLGFSIVLEVEYYSTVYVAVVGFAAVAVMDPDTSLHVQADSIPGAVTDGIAIPHSAPLLAEPLVGRQPVPDPI